MLRLTVLILAILSSGLLHADNMEECQKIVQLGNKSMPKQIDKYTTLQSMKCVESNPKNIIVYRNSIEVDLISLRNINFAKEVKPKMMEAVCPMAGSKILLNKLDLKYEYYSKENKLGGRYYIKESDCREANSR